MNETWNETTLNNWAYQHCGISPLLQYPTDINEQDNRSITVSQTA